MKESYKEFVKQIIFWGRFTLLAAWICSFLPPLYLAVVYGIMPEVTSIVKAFSMIASVMRLPPIGILRVKTGQLF